MKEKRYIRFNDIVVSLNDSGAILHSPETLTDRFLNYTGWYIWETLDGTNSVEGISRKVVEHFESVSQREALQDVKELIADLEKLGFIREANEGEVADERKYPHVNDAPDSMDISLTGKCNLHCDYCFYANEMHNRPDLSIKEWFRFIDEIGDLAVKDVALSGGEVFVRKDLFDIVDRIIENRIRYSILSNGTLITEDVLQKFDVGKRKARLSSIQVSIDGSRAGIHDRSRGEGSFVKAVRGLRLLKEAGFPVTVRVTINRFNIDDLEGVSEFLLENIGLDSFGTNDAMPMGSGCENQSSITLSPEQQLKAIQIMHKLNIKYNGRINATAGPLSKWRTYGEMEHAKATGEKSKRYQMGYLTACGCMFNKLAVHHDGIIVPCNMLPDLEMGRINKDSIKLLWKNHQVLKDLKNRRKIPMSKVPDCQGCEWNEFCNGSCPGLPYTITGDFNRANLHDCYRNFLKETGLKSPNVPWYQT